MIELFSTNVTANTNSSIPLSNVSLIKGITATKEGNSVSLNKCGVYVITFDGTVTIPTGGTVDISLRKDGFTQPQSTITVTGTATDIVPFSKHIFIQVPFSNTPSPCTAPTIIDFIGTVEAIYPQFNVTVSKLV